MQLRKRGSKVGEKITPIQNDGTKSVPKFKNYIVGRKPRIVRRTNEVTDSAD